MTIRKLKRFALFTVLGAAAGTALSWAYAAFGST
jgi:hypothetical protein